jgi:1-deoxy-D-xylulose-5-phosphate synthase
MTAYPLLETVDDPADIRTFDRKQLAQLATELRSFIVDSVAATGGHLSSNLGTVELTIALPLRLQHADRSRGLGRGPPDLRPQDPHRPARGHEPPAPEGRHRRASPRREESPYDTFGTAHSSTSISAALGMAGGREGAGRRAHVVAGDRRWAHDGRHGLRGAQQRRAGRVRTSW